MLIRQKILCYYFNFAVVFENELYLLVLPMGQRHFCIKDTNGIYLDIVQGIEPTEESLQGYGNK